MRSQSQSRFVGDINATVKVAWMMGWILAASAWAGEWPCWRGARGDGVSEETNAPVRWSSIENVAWKVPIPGVGHSSPVIGGDRVFVTTYLEQGHRRVLLCLDRPSGKTLWEKTVVTAAPEQKHNLNSYASGTPATDGQRVWVALLQARDIVVVCLDMDGKELWRKSPGTFASVHGFCSSPVPYKDMIILNCDQDAVACIVAFDKATGSERWRTDRPNRTRSYCTPTIFQAAGKQQMVLSGSKCVASYDPDTGKQHWLIDGPTDQFVAGVVFTDDIFFVTGGFPDLHIVAIRPDGEGNVTASHIAWRDTQGVSYVPSPIAHGKYFFVVADRGLATCFEAKTGQRMWQEKLGRHHSASAVSAGGNLYFLDDDGRMFVLKAGPQFEVIAKNDLGEECYASPAISRGQIFIRTLGNLYCIGTR
ncbi:MAG: PQQ-binding-like beta-propeller repeat protein [Verrucomicrobia bacterium]|nr:PQQ-binding-like beta-propeller repeat protein [Verrucomicrobiota bacterium]